MEQRVAGGPGYIMMYTVRHREFTACEGTSVSSQIRWQYKTLTSNISPFKHFRKSTTPCKTIILMFCIHQFARSDILIYPYKYYFPNQHLILHLSPSRMLIVVSFNSSSAAPVTLLLLLSASLPRFSTSLFLRADINRCNALPRHTRLLAATRTVSLSYSQASGFLH